MKRGQDQGDVVGPFIRVLDEITNTLLDVVCKVWVTYLDRIVQTASEIEDLERQIDEQAKENEMARRLRTIQGVSDCDHERYRYLPTRVIARNKNLHISKRFGRPLLRNWRGYHRRSRVAPKMGCLKRLQQQLTLRDLGYQAAELQLNAAADRPFTAQVIPHCAEKRRIWKRKNLAINRLAQQRH